MRLELRDYQETATAAIVRYLRRAQRDWHAPDRDATAVVLAAPTGSGKTIIATAAIERLLFGDDLALRNERAVFLWLTDNLDLNEQTRRKMLSTSTVLRGDRLLTVSAESFDAERLSPGNVYFINTQKLTEAGILTTPADRRAYTFWDTIANTVNSPDLDFYLVIDEAHRGMAGRREDFDRATTILQKFVFGTPDMPASPVILGVSATPARFDALLGTTTRGVKRHPINPADVRASGLIVERIVIERPDEDQPSDLTLLRKAVRRWQASTTAWRDYCVAEHEPAVVVPALLIQVEDGNARTLTATDIPAALTAIGDEAAGLPDDAFVHCFQDHGDLDIGGRTIRYLAPPNIAGDPDARIIFFKTALNTGWDCPRAEVMFSYRKVEDRTAVAQLVGRMVRTPLARAIAGHDDLNSVSVFLPRFDRPALEGIVRYLTESGEAPGATDEPQVVLLPIAGSEAALAALNGVKTEVVPHIRRLPDIRRICLLADALSIDGLDATASTREREALVDLLVAAHAGRAADPEYQALLAERASLRVRSTTWTVFDALGPETADDIEEIVVSAENIGDLYDRAARVFEADVARRYWLRRIAAEPAARASGRLEVIALASYAEVANQVAAAAQARVSALLAAHGRAIAELPDARQVVYERVRQSSPVPTAKDFEAPATIETKRVATTWPGHLYRDSTGAAPFTLGSWEAAVVRAEVARGDFVGWLRNIDRRDWALEVAYTDRNGLTRPLYPDILSVRRAGEALVVDLLDPHNPTLDDGPAKAKGLARFAATYGWAFGRIEAIALVNDEIKRLNLQDEATRQSIAAAADGGHLLSLYR